MMDAPVPIVQAAPTFNDAAAAHRPEASLALAILQQADKDLRTGYSTRERATAALFLAGEGPYRDVLAFWCEVAGIEPETIIRHTWRKYHDRLKPLLRHRVH